MKDYIVLSLLFCLSVNCTFAEKNQDHDLNEFLHSLKSTDALLNCLNKKECKTKLDNHLPKGEFKNHYYDLLVRAKTQLKNDNLDYSSYFYFFLIPLNILILVGEIMNGDVTSFSNTLFSETLNKHLNNTSKNFLNVLETINVNEQARKREKAIKVLEQEIEKIEQE